ncbi:DUF6766 family protein [Streptomyces sp. NPDC056689]|uniref:DUF6766 family protein n=1 Tax=unclassified Streptomyces TaxID=2593676 RepID=UPI00363F9107
MPSHTSGARSSPRALRRAGAVGVAFGLLAVASVAICSVHLRQRGSPESQPVGAPRSASRCPKGGESEARRGPGVAQVPAVPGPGFSLRA